MTKTAVADVLGLSIQQYKFFEDYVRIKKMPLELAFKLADLFGVTLDDIRRYEEALKNA